jgi:hypothetical protein
MTNTQRKVVTPKINAFVYRVAKSIDTVGTNKGVVSPIFMKEVSDISSAQDRIKGIEHEQTALFGGVLDLNLATDPRNDIFDTLLPDDHVEVFYKDLADTAQKGTFMKVVPVTQYLSDEMRATDLAKTQDPKFSGVAWKGELIEKPSQVTTKVKAWDYHRMLQYMNIPRGQSSSTYVRYIDIDPFQTEGDLKEVDIRARGSVDIKPNNDLLDYIDHTVQTYLKKGTTEGSVFMFSPPPIKEEGTVNYTIRREKNPLKLKGYVVSGRTGGDDANRMSVKLDAMWTDYPTLKAAQSGLASKPKAVYQLETESEKFTSEDIPAAIKKIKESVSSKQTMCITRFMDANITVASGWSAVGNPIGPKYRVVGEIVALDQFALGHMITAGMTYDYGISEWFTPVPAFSAALQANLAEQHLSVTEGNEKFPISASRLVYVRWYAGKFEGSQSAPKVAMKRIACFNLDSFSGLLEYMSRAVHINLQAISATVKGVKLTENTDFINRPEFLTMVLASVNFPQQSIGHTFYWKTRDQQYDYQDIAEKIATSNSIDLSGDAGAQFRTLMKYHLNNITQYSSLMNAAFELDDKLISFMTNIPSSYMRADIYTGSRFKTFSYDSLSIIRVLQILSSTMKGFPATNNPIHTGQQAVPEGATEKVQKVDHYPIFLANRIIVRSKLVWVPNKRISSPTHGGISDFNESAITQQVYQGFSSITAAKDYHSGYTQEGIMFLILEVDYKKQVYDTTKADFKIPVGDINDLSMTKGSSVSHLVNLSFDEHSHFLDKLKTDVDLSDTKPALSYNLGGRTNRTISPAEFSPITMTDMTQNDTYDSLIARSAANINVEVADGASGFPIHDAGVGYTLLRDSSPSTWDKGSFMISNWATRKTESQTGDQIDTDHQNGTKAFQNRLVDVATYVNFTDIQNEIKLLRRFADPTKYTAGYQRIERTSDDNNEQALFDNIEIVADYEIGTTLDKYNKTTFVVRPVTEKKAISLTEFLRLPVFTELLAIKKEQMAWMVPLRGNQLIFNESAKRGKLVNNVQKEGIGELEEVSYSDDIDNKLFDEFKNMYLVISYLDLIIKGLRYLLWTISKSRFLGHAYLPMNYAGYTQTQEETIRVVTDLEPGSSIVFKLEDGNVRRMPIATGLIPQLRGKSGDIVLVETQDQHQLEVVETDSTSGKSPLIWYVSKKIVYIGEDSGAMMRLNMTEGSFDWTVFYREDTQMTRMSEYFLMNGMGNFFLSRKGT